MNVLLQGVGGIGGITAAHLITAGFRVTPVTGNPAIADAINAEGFRIDGIDGPKVVRPVVPASAGVPADGGPYDIILLATQSTSLESALEASCGQLARDGVVVCFQNGLPEERAARIVGPQRVIGCVVGWGGSMVAPGQYRRTSNGGFQLGRIDGRNDPQVARVEELLTHVAPVHVTANLAGVRWSKLAINSAITTLGAVGGDRLGALLRHRFVRRLALEIFTEVVAVARAQQVRLEKVNGTLDLERIALQDADRQAPLGSPSLLWKHSILVAVGMKYRRMRSSMLYALERGRRPEVEHLNGEVVRRGQALDIAAPVNRRLIEVVGEIAQGKQVSSLQTLRRVYEGARSA